MKVLYLEGRQGVKVLLDGPALRAQSAGRADGRYPLSRLSRIVALGDVVWNPRALLACLHYQVPIAVLDSRGRFVRLRCCVGNGERGLARHLGGLLEIARYQTRYQRWLRRAEHLEREAVAVRYGINDWQHEGLWTRVNEAQFAQGLRRRPGQYYAYLRGLATAHIASMLSRIGIPADIEMWSKQEYRLLNDLVRLEQWRHVDIVGHCITHGDGRADRRILTKAFESQAAEREQRFAAWRQGLICELLGLRLHDPYLSVAVDHPWREKPLTSVPDLLARERDSALGAIGGETGRPSIALRSLVHRRAMVRKSWIHGGQSI